MSVPENFKSILWEYELSKLNLDDNIVTERVLSLWDTDITNFWIKTLWKVKSKKLFIKNKDKLDKKSLNYWGIIFWIDVNKDLKINQSMYEKLNTPVFSRSFK